MVISERNGALIGAVQVQENNEIMLISDQGTLVRTRVSEVSTLGRNTQGVTLIKVQEGERLVGVAPILDADEDDFASDHTNVDPDAVNDPAAEGDLPSDVESDSEE
jgi:DNA gyrase subunit A